MSVGNCRIVRVLLASLAAQVFCPPAVAQWRNPKANIPPPAKRQRRSAGESFPPLPLPATPLRRTERKRQPAPPALVGMINFSQSQFRLVQGRRERVSVFPTTQIDIERLMTVANARLKIRYRYMNVSLESFSWNPAELPLLYVTGWTPLPQLSEAMVRRLRRYLYDGGTLVVHAQCGRKEFTRTARQWIRRILPSRRLAPVDGDSALLLAYYPMTQMRVRRGEGPFSTIKPFIEVVYLGCRPAIIYSPIDLNCGWDVARNPIAGETIMYHQDDALKLGVNIITAVLANFEYARAWGTARVYAEQDQKTRDQLVIAQVVHEGDWDPTPHALANLMKFIARNTTLNVQSKRDLVNLADVEASRHPVLYMTGIRDFVLSDRSVARLREYLAEGGVLIADAAAGRAAFDNAFRREMKRVLPKAPLKRLRGDSPIYAMPYKIRSVDYTELAKASAPHANAPMLEGITIDGQLAVIYSSMSLSNGWEQLAFAYNRGYGEADSLRIGVNAFAYALTH